MTADVDDLVRRAFDDIIDAAGDLGPCPTAGDAVVMRDAATVEAVRSRRGTRALGWWEPSPQRWVGIAAAVLLVVGLGAVGWVTQREGSAPSVSAPIDVGPVDQFQAGSVTAISDPALFVVNDPSGGIVVFDARSTHLGCRLILNRDDVGETVRVPDPDVVFVDPCHGSLFDRAGNKLAGPAPRSLDRYPVTISEQRVRVDVSQPFAGDLASTPVYSGADLDLSLPVVGRGWGDSMEFSLSPGTNARFYEAWQTAIADCMQSRGYDYEPVSFPENGGFEDRVNPLDRRYATVMGYHEIPAEPNDPNTHTEESAAAAGDCANVAYSDTWGRISDYVKTNDQLRAGLSAAIDGFADSNAGQAVTSQWSACMTERGHDYASRIDAIIDYAERPTVSADEISTRLDDLDCDIAVGYTQTEHDWEQVQVDAWRQAQSDTINEVIALMQDVEQQLAAIEAEQLERQD